MLLEVRIPYQAWPGYNRNPDDTNSMGSQSWWAYLDSNQGPTGYEPVALAN